MIPQPDRADLSSQNPCLNDPQRTFDISRARVLWLFAKPGSLRIVLLSPSSAPYCFDTKLSNSELTNSELNNSELTNSELDNSELTNLFVLTINLVKHLFRDPQTAYAYRPAAVMGEVDHNLVDLLAADASVESAAEMDFQFPFTG